MNLLIILFFTLFVQEKLNLMLSGLMILAAYSDQISKIHYNRFLNKKVLWKIKCILLI